MNATTTVISVNPGKATVGSLHPEAAGIFRRRILGTREVKPSPIKGWLNAFFGLHGYAPKQMWKSLAGMRVGFSLILTSMILLGALPEMGVGMEVALWCAIASIAIGLCARFSACICTLFFAQHAIAVALGGTIDMSMALCTFIAAMIAWMGPGMMSVDTVVRAFLFRRLSHWGRERRHRAQRLSYRAYLTPNTQKPTWY